MCDHVEFEKLKDRMMALEKSQLVQGEQIKTLFNIVKVQNKVVWAFAFIMLLALIYGALGPRGFNAVTNAAQSQIAK